MAAEQNSLVTVICSLHGFGMISGKMTLLKDSFQWLWAACLGKIKNIVFLLMCFWLQLIRSIHLIAVRFGKVWQIPGEIASTDREYTLLEKLPPGDYRYNVHILNGNSLVDSSGVCGLEKPATTFTITPWQDLSMPENRRPTGVTLLALFILGMALWNGLRLVQAIVFWSIMKEYQAEPGPLYTSISGGVWLLAGLSIVWGLWKEKGWARFAALGSAAVYGFWYWFNRLVMQEPHSNWPFALMSTLISISFFSVLFRRSAIHFFDQKTPFVFSFFKSRYNDSRKTPNKKN